MKRYAGRATGRVQGVGFRVFVQKNASELGVTGWVRNMDDGSVTMEAQGDENKLNELEARIKKGSFIISVNELKWDEIPALTDGAENGFEIIRK